MKQLFVAAVVTAFAMAQGETRTWVGGGDGKFSTGANWSGGIAPANQDTLSFDAASGGVIENDVDDLWLNQLAFPAGSGSYTITGKPLRVKGVTYNAGAAESLTLDADFLSNNRYCDVTVPAGHTITFNGKIGYAGTANCAFLLKGDGTKVIHGGIDTSNCTETDNDTNSYAPRFQGGTFLIDSPVRVPRIHIDGNSHVILTNGATFTLLNKGAQNTFIQTCTIDIHNSIFRNQGFLIYAQSPNSTAHIRVFDGGLFDSGLVSFRPGNNGVAMFSVYDGGTFQWRAGNFSENGKTILNLEGGRFMRSTDGNADFGIGQIPVGTANYQNKGPNELNLNGGEFWVKTLNNNSNISYNKSTKTIVNFNGSTFMCTGNVENFWNGQISLIDAKVHAGGIRVNTRGFSVGWQLTCESAVADGVDGGLTKLGPGTFTLKAAQAFTGPVTVKAGTLAATDASFVTQRVAIDRGATFAPGGAATLAGLDVNDGVLQVVGGNVVTVTTAPTVAGTLFVKLVDASGAAVTECGTYDVLVAPGLDGDFAAKCRSVDGAADRVYVFGVTDGRLQVTVSEGTNPDVGVAASAWAAASGGAWGEAGNWSAGVPGGVDAEATFGGAIASAGMVTVDDDVTVGKIVFDSDKPYTLAGDGAINFAARNGEPTISAQNGAHVIAAPIVSGAPVKVESVGSATVKLTGDLSGTPGVEITGGTTVIVDDLSQLDRMMFTGGAVYYAGSADASASVPAMKGNGTIKVLEGAGKLTLTGAPKMSTAGTLQIQGNNSEEIVFAGEGWMKAPNDYQRFWLTGGDYRFASDLQFNWMCLDKNSTMTRELFRVGGLANVPTSLTIEDGAEVRVYDARFGADGDNSGSPLTIMQNGGVFDIGYDVNFNGQPQTNALTFTKMGGFTGSGWLNFMHGPITFRQTDGETAFSDLSFGYRLVNGSNYTKWGMPGNGLIDIAGGTFSVAGNWSWASDSSNDRTDRVRLTGGTLEIPATTRAKVYDRMNPGNYSTLELAGGTLRLCGAGAASGSAEDYLAGLNTLALSGAMTIDTAGGDATITQPVRATKDEAAIVKDGAGTLTLAATNDVPARVCVEKGTLAAGFRTDAYAKRPHGLLALWTFDGEDPYRDETGNGYDLEQAVAAKEVQFTEELAHTGKCAHWPVVGAALKCTNVSNMKLLRTTVSLWVRLESKNFAISHIGMFSTRVNRGMNGCNTSFDIAYKNNIGEKHNNESGIGNCFSGSELTGIPKSAGGDISLQEWHMITIVRDCGHVRSYVDGVFAKDVNVTGSAVGATLLDSSRMITLGANIANETGLREVMNQNGRLDDVAVYSRCLSDEEVAALYAAERKEAAADEVRVASGATLDLRDTAIVAKTLAGAGVVANGIVTAAERLEADPGLPLTADALVLGSEGVLDCGRTEDNPLPTSGKWVVVNANAVTGADPRKWTVTGTGVAAKRARYKLGIDEDNNLVLEAGSSGTTLIIR